eukprot:m51a1_g2895 hypothetical protein (1596) ;mRNA; r:439894-455092
MTRDQDLGHDPVVYQAEAYAQAMMRAQAVRSIDDILWGIAIPFTVFDRKALFEYMQVVGKKLAMAAKMNVAIKAFSMRALFSEEIKLVEVDISKANGKTIIPVIHKHIKKWEDSTFEELSTHILHVCTIEQLPDTKPFIIQRNVSDSRKLAHLAEYKAKMVDTGIWEVIALAGPQLTDDVPPPLPPNLFLFVAVAMDEQDVELVDKVEAPRREFVRFACSKGVRCSPDASVLDFDGLNAITYTSSAPCTKKLTTLLRFAAEICQPLTLCAEPGEAEQFDPRCISRFEDSIPMCIEITATQRKTSENTFTVLPSDVFRQLGEGCSGQFAGPIATPSNAGLFFSTVQQQTTEWKSGKLEFHKGTHRKIGELLGSNKITLAEKITPDQALLIAENMPQARDVLQRYTDSVASEEQKLEACWSEYVDRFRAQFQERSRIAFEPFEQSVRGSVHKMAFVLVRSEFSKLVQGLRNGETLHIVNRVDGAVSEMHRSKEFDGLFADCSCTESDFKQVSKFITEQRFSVIDQHELGLVASSKTSTFSLVYDGAASYLVACTPIEDAPPVVQAFSLSVSFYSSDLDFADSLSGLTAAVKSPPLNMILDHCYHIFDKFPVTSAITQYSVGSCEGAPRRLTFEFLVEGSETKAKALASYAKDLHGTVSSRLGKSFAGLFLEYRGISKSEHLLTTAGRSTEGSLMALGDLLVKVICLTPIQVARVEFSTFRPLRDGLALHSPSAHDEVEAVVPVAAAAAAPGTPETSEGLTAEELGESLTFGMYDAVLASHDLPVTVICCMGCQSSGKSSLLNQLGGTLFDVSGGRCTDGVWMSIKVLPHRIYVLLDFEGLGSFERTHQQDMFLALVGAAMGSVCILRVTMQYDRFTESTLRSLGDGGRLLRAGPTHKFFGGRLIINPRDVQASKTAEVFREFKDKVNSTVAKYIQELSETERQSITRGPAPLFGLFHDWLFQPTPQFASMDYNRTALAVFQSIDSLEPKFETGTEFRHALQLVLARIGISDFSTLDETVGKRTAQFVQMRLRDALCTGLSMELKGRFLPEQAVRERVAQLCSASFVLVSPFPAGQSLSFTQSAAGNGIELVVHDLHDAGLHLSAIESLCDDEDKARASHLAELHRILIGVWDAILPLSGSEPQRWKSNFQAFVKAVVERRFAKVCNWIDQLASSFDEKMNLELIPDCDFCALRGESVVCAESAGHFGKHHCRKQAHECGEPCSQSTCVGCNKVCSLEIGHTGTHWCSTPPNAHLCGCQCSAASCSGQCTYPYSQPHDRHLCSPTARCPMRCQLCTAPCKSENHFHSEDDPVAAHLCEQDHQCPHHCEEPGICSIDTRRFFSTKQYKTKTGQDIQYEEFSEQNGQRRECCIRIPAGKLAHRGDHTCILKDADASVVFHFCGERCACCKYYCTKRFGHPADEPHDCNHGNMRSTKLLCAGETMNVKSHSFGRGDSGIVFLCPEACRQRGRGHLHLIPCRCTTHPREDTVRRHDKTVSEDGSKQYDVCTCAYFWANYLGFRGPFSDDEAHSFSLCGCHCASDHQSGQQQEPQYYHSDSAYLQELATIGRGQHQNTVNRLEMVEAFQTLATLPDVGDFVPH